MKRCPLCFQWHANTIGACPPLEEPAVDRLKDDALIQADPPYIQAALESAKAAREFLETEKAAELLKADGSTRAMLCRECGQNFERIYSETVCMYCREVIERP